MRWPEISGKRSAGGRSCQRVRRYPIRCLGRQLPDPRCCRYCAESALLAVFADLVPTPLVVFTQPLRTEAALRGSILKTLSIRGRTFREWANDGKVIAYRRFDGRREGKLYFIDPVDIKRSKEVQHHAPHPSEKESW